MKNNSRFHVGAGMVDYVLPTLIIGAIAGTGLYYLGSGGAFKNNLLGSLNAKIDETKSELAFGTDKLKPGLYKNADGTYSLITKSGNTVAIPEGYYNSIKGSVEEYLNMKASETTTSVGEETTGVYGGESMYEDVDFLTGQYAEILKNMADEVENKTAKTILKNLAAYTTKMSDLQTSLKTIKQEITTSKENYENSQIAFMDARKDFVSYLSSQATNSEFNAKTLNDKFIKFRESYTDYQTKTQEYRDKSKQYVETASDSFKKMNKDTGIGFELLLFLAKTYDKIPEEAKNIAIPVGDEIKNIKDNIKLTKENVNFLKTILNDENQTITSEMNTAFETVKIILDQDEAKNVATENTNSTIASSTDGTTTTKTNSDGSSTTTTKNSDGTATIANTAADGTTTVTTTASTTTLSSSTTQNETKNLEDTKSDLITMINDEMSDSDDDIINLSDNTGIETSVTVTLPEEEEEEEGVTKEKADEIVVILEGLDVNDQDNVETAAENIISIIGINDTEETETTEGEDG